MELKNIFNKPVNTKIQSLVEVVDIDVTNFTLDLLLSLEESFYNINNDFLYANHTGLNDLSSEILTEGFNDFIGSVISFFQKLLKRIKEFGQQVFTYLNAYIADFDKFINQNAEKIMKQNPDFKLGGYEYTFNSNIPKLDKLMHIVHSYNSEISELEHLKKADIIKEREEFISSDNIGRIRADVIGLSGEISSEEFLERTKSVFRNGRMDTKELHINRGELIKTVEGYKNLKKTLLDAKKENERIILLIGDMLNFFQRSASVYYKGGSKSISVNHITDNIKKDGSVETSYDINRIDVINTFFNFKFIQSKEIGNICVLVITEKVNAIKEALKQSKTIIRQSFFNEKGG
jgi:hypothetical protein